MISAQLLCVCLMRRRVCACVYNRGERVREREGEQGQRGGEERVQRTSER